MNELVLQAEALGVELGGRRVVDGVSVQLRSGGLTAIVGPNGAGKTSLLRALAGLIPSEGLLRLGETDPRLASPAELARLRAYCAQRPVCAWDYRVGELGEIVGRPTAYAGWLAQLEMEGHAERRLSSLSGGELKAAHLAMTFAQLEEPFGKALLLDEPAAALDLRRQEAVVRALRRFAADGAACLVATHELRFAQGCDQALVLAEGRMIAAGPPAAALTPAIVDEAWGRAPA